MYDTLMKYLMDLKLFQVMSIGLANENLILYVVSIFHVK